MTDNPATARVDLGPRIDGEHPLSRTQSLIWASQRLDPSTPLANMGKVHRINGPLEPEQLVAAFDDIVRSSDALRTVVTERHGHQPSARVLSHPPATTDVIDLDLHELDAWCDQRLNDPIDATASAYDSVLIRHAPDDWTWWLDLHHIATDAFASALIFDRTSRRYEDLIAGRDEVADAAAGGFYDHVATQAERSDDSRRERRRAFWAERTNDAAPITPYGPRGPRTTRTARIDVDLRGDLDAAITGPYATLSRELSLLALASATTATTLERLDGRTTVTLGVPIHHRSGPVAPSVIGPLMELYPMRLTIEAGSTFKQVFDQAYREVVALLKHARPGESPDVRFDAVINVLTARFGDFAGLPTTTTWARSGHVDANHPLRVQIYDYGDGLRVEVDVNTSLSADGSHHRFGGHVGRMLDAAIADPDAFVDATDMMLADDAALVAALNPPALEDTPLRPVHEVVRDRLSERPDAATAEHDGITLTRSGLDASSDRLAAWLVERGIRPGARVGIRMPRSIDVMIALHGVLRAGAAFVMLDPADPAARHAAIEQDAALALILDRLPELSESVPGPTRVEVGLDDEAYVLYTSGSTGTPKGVPISHRGLADYLRFATDAYAGDGPVVMPLHSSLVFDLTITSLFLPQLTGGRTVVFDGDALSALGSIARRHDLTVLKATPSQLELLTRMIDDPLPLRVAIIGGEAFRRPVAEAFAHACVDGLRIFNEYGPTEAVVGCMIHEWDAAHDSGVDVPIGHACPGADVHVIDARGRPTPVGAWGELYVRRPGMAGGYLHLPELSAERFASVPAIDDQPIYRTGDIVRVERDVLVYGGRIDDQMKVGGVRLEPGEIEAALVTHPQVVNAVVRVWTTGTTNVQRCVRCGLGTDIPDVTIDDGVCSVCHSYDDVEPQAASWFRSDADLDELRVAAATRATGDYDCLHLLSGGKDSTYALYQLVERGWRVHALTLDNGYISDGAKANIASSVADLGISHEFVTTTAMAEIFRDSLDRFANVCNGCYKTIYTLATARAHELGIPVIVTGLSRGQFFETRLVPHQFESDRFDPDAIDRTVLEARRAYHRTTDAVTDLLPEQQVFERGDLDVLDEISYVDFYRYVDVELSEMYEFLEQRAPWVRPADTGRSTNCLVNVAGIHVHLSERGYHNYAEPYSWDVRLGHKTRDEALEELDDEIDLVEVQQMLDEIGYVPKRTELLTAWYQTNDGCPIDPVVLRSHLRELLPERSVPAAFVHVDDLPLADSAKIDVAALPRPSRTHASAGDYVAPTTPTEATAAAVWASVLDVDRVGIDDDFFDLGGSSLPALELIASMEARIGIDLPDALVFTHRVLRDFAAAVDQQITSGEATTAIPPLADDRRPLSPTEAAMLFEYRSSPGDTRYNVTRLYTVDDDLDDDRLRRAIETVVARHQPLHTSFGPGREVLAPSAACSIEAMPGDDPDDFADRQRRVPFDLDHGPLVRVHVSHHEPDTTKLLIAMHHLSVDAGTFDTLWSEIDAAYHGRTLPDLTTTVAAHGEWQRARWNDAIVHWAQAADRTDRDGNVTLPTPEAPEPDGYIEIVTSMSTSTLRSGSATTPFASSLAAAATVLAAYSRTGKVELGITASTKDHPDTEPLVGYFLNTLPVMIDVDPDISLRELDHFVGQLVADALPHRTLPLAEIVERARRAGRATPDVRHMLAYERLAPATWGERTAEHEIFASGTSVSELTFFVQERDDELRLGLEYRGSVIARADAVRLLDAFDNALRSIVEHSHRTTTTVMATLAGTDLIGAGLDSPAQTVLHQIAEHVASSPGAPAVTGQTGDTLSYEDLWAASGNLAARIVDMVAAPRRIGVAVGRSTDMVVAILGAMLSGAAYVALDPTLPRHRLDRIVAQAALDGVIVDASTRGWFEGIGEVEIGGTAPVDSHTVHRLPESGDEAYLIFTSGSTGTPAGVSVTHANLAASNAARPEFYLDLRPRRFLLTSSIGFDSSIVGLFWPLTSGGAVVVPGDDDVHDVDRLADVVVRHGVTHLLMVPSLYRAMLERRHGLLVSLECAIVAGEACPSSLVRRHAELLPGVVLVNEYGPTEATVWATAHYCSTTDDPVPIGTPIAGVTARIITEGLRPIGRGATGELLVAGPGVTAGYVDGRSDDAFIDMDERHWYRTGDLVRADHDDRLIFVGRRDDQLNVGGIRIEPSEIEAAISELDGVDDAAVVASNVGGRETLVAHVQSDQHTVTVDEIRSHLAGRLVAGAVPRIIEIHPSLPRTPHGKLDRAALAELALDIDAHSPPGSSGVLAIWRSALREPRLADDADFFALGGDSLAAVEVVTALSNLAGHDVPVAALLDAPTPAEMVRWLDLADEASSVRPEGLDNGRLGDVRLVTMRPGRANGPVVLLAAAWDDIQGYRALADALPDEITAIAAVVVGDDPRLDHVDAVVDLTLDRLDLMALQQRDVAVVGWSVGGLVAFDLAQRLHAASIDVGIVAMVDTFFPGEQRHLWSNRWWKYKSMLRPGALASAATDLSNSVRRRTRSKIAAVARRVLAWAGDEAPMAAEPRTSPGGIPFVALDHVPTTGSVPVTLYAATTTNPARTIEPWRQLVPELRVVRLGGRHRGHDSIMGIDRVSAIADDVADQINQ